MQDLECDCKRILLICTRKCKPLVKVYLTLNWSSNMPISYHCRFLTTLLYTVFLKKKNFSRNWREALCWNISLKIQNSIFLHFLSDSLIPKYFSLFVHMIFNFDREIDNFNFDRKIKYILLVPGSIMMCIIKRRSHFDSLMYLNNICLSGKCLWFLINTN